MVSFTYSKAQVKQKSLDTTIAAQHIDFSNNKAPKLAYPYSGTFAIDSPNVAGERRLIKLDYLSSAKLADSLFEKKRFAEASDAYRIAFKINNDMGQVKHRYNLARCYARLNMTDDAFVQLYRIAEKGNYYNYFEIENDAFFSDIKKDNRWLQLVTIIKHNAAKMENKLNESLPARN